MNLIFLKKDDGTITAQKWRFKPSDLISGYFNSLIVQAIALPAEDEALSIDDLIAKYGAPK